MNCQRVATSSTNRQKSSATTMAASTRRRAAVSNAKVVHFFRILFFSHRSKIVSMCVIPDVCSASGKFTQTDSDPARNLGCSRRSRLAACVRMFEQIFIRTNFRLHVERNGVQYAVDVDRTLRCLHEVHLSGKYTPDQPWQRVKSCPPSTYAASWNTRYHWVYVEFQSQEGTSAFVRGGPCR